MDTLFRTFVFEVHVEKRRLLGNMDLPSAIAAFLHLAFVCDLKYPKVGFNLVLGRILWSLNEIKSIHYIGRAYTNC